MMRREGSTELTIEPMRRRHLRRVLEIEQQVYPRPWTHRTFVSELDQARSGLRHYIVSFVGDVLAGYAGLMFVDDDAHVTNIAVDPAWHGRGVGTEMMLELFDVALAHGSTAMTLEVRHSNAPAQGLYRKFGFAPAGVRRKYYENRDDAIVMWCQDISSARMMDRLRRIGEEGR
jgi:ribosomal-protein-alanine N-acetyltransferase